MSITKINASEYQRDGNNENTANGVVTLDENGKLPAVNGENLQNVSAEINSLDENTSPPQEGAIPFYNPNTAKNEKVSIDDLGKNLDVSASVGVKTFTLGATSYPGDVMKMGSDGKISPNSFSQSVNVSWTGENTYYNAAALGQAGDSIFNIGWDSYNSGVRMRGVDLAGNHAFGSQLTLSGCREGQWARPINIGQYSGYDTMFILYRDNQNSGQIKATNYQMKSSADNLSKNGNTVTINSGNGGNGLDSCKIGTNRAFSVYTVGGQVYGHVATLSSWNFSSVDCGQLGISGVTTNHFYALGLEYVKDGEFLLSYVKSGTGYVVHGTVNVSTGAVTLGTEVSLGAVDSYQTRVQISKHSETKFTISYIVDQNSNNGRIRTINLSGSTITLGNAYTVNSGTETEGLSHTFIGGGRIAISFREATGNYYVKYALGFVDGDTISGYTSEYNIIAYGINPFVLPYGYNGFTITCGKSGDGMIFAYGQSADGMLGLAKEYGTTNQSKSLTMLGGISSVHSGLTPGAEMSVGTAISDTEILVHRGNQ